MKPFLQEWIHKLEVGEGVRWMRALLAILALVAIAALFASLEYRNLSRPDVMDAAQVGRQLARGQGFTTLSIRPWSVALLEGRARDNPGATNDPGRLRSLHPDLANPPVYPCVLAAAQKLTAVSPEIPMPQSFRIYRPDLMVVLVNLGLVVVLVILTYGLALRVFDRLVAWLAAVALAGSQLFWQLAGEGQSTVLATLWVTALAYCVVVYDAGARQGQWGSVRLACAAALAGLFVALAGLTCYALLALVLPLVAVLAPGLPGRRWSTLLAALGVVVVMVMPWLLRNHQLSGNWFGTAGAALLVNTEAFPGDALERSLEPTLSSDLLRQTLRNGVVQMGAVLQDDLPRLGGSWVSAFFLVGLLFRFSDPTRDVLRGFALLSLLVLLPARALSRAGAPDMELDYLAVIAPTVVLLGVAFFSSLLEHVDWGIEAVRPLVQGVFVVVMALPLAVLLLPPGRDPRTYPPYHPPLIRRLADWVRPDELIMSDMPWAVAWYADRTSLWLTRYAVDPDGREDFLAVNDFRRTVAALYLTQRTTDAEFFTRTQQPRLAREVARARAEREGESWNEDRALNATDWPEFAGRGFVQGRMVAGFPLRSAHAAYAVSGQLLLMAEPRWPTGERPAGPGSESGANEVEGGGGKKP